MCSFLSTKQVGCRQGLKLEGSAASSTHDDMCKSVMWQPASPALRPAVLAGWAVVPVWQVDWLCPATAWSPTKSQPRPDGLALPVPVVTHSQLCTCWQHPLGPPSDHRPGPDHQLSCMLSGASLAVQVQLTFSGVSILSRSQLQRSLSGMCMNCSQERQGSGMPGSTRRHDMTWRRLQVGRQA